MTRSLSLSTTNPSAQKQTTTINYINPDASDNKIYQLAQMITNLSDNTLNTATKIDRTTLQTKNTPTLTLAETTVQSSEIISRSAGDTPPYCYEIAITYTGNGQLYAEATPGSGAEGAILANVYKISGSWKLRIAWVLQEEGRGTIKVIAPETDTYDSTEATLTITP